MPGRDRTGPWGNGAGTGWGLGPCGAGAARGRSGANRAGFGCCRGFGSGFGPGLGGRGGRGFAAGRGRGFAAPYSDTPGGRGIEDEMSRIETLGTRLEQKLKAIRARLGELRQDSEPVEETPGSASSVG